jgi:hypothetical protein
VPGANSSIAVVFRGSARHYRPSDAADSNSQTRTAREQHPLLTSFRITLKVDESDIGQTDASSFSILFFAWRFLLCGLPDSGGEMRGAAIR